MDAAAAGLAADMYGTRDVNRPGGGAPAGGGYAGGAGAARRGMRRG
jgi:hypothetical protein